MTHDAEREQDALGQPPARGLASFAVRLFLRTVGFFVLASIAAFGVGFLVFYAQVAALAPIDNPKADAIVALTGGYQRIDQAVQLLAQGAGRRLLISGVNPATSVRHIRSFTNSREEIFQCCVDIGYDARNTEGNASETVQWIRAHRYKTVILVTNNYHMPRSLAEIRRLDHDTEFMPYPVEKRLTLSDIAANPLMLRTLASEYVKYLLVVSRDYTGIVL
ncbi:MULTISPECIES: YdcF family protein [unclassified Rhizobium]|uniref:YdcF family protein n=1 Tax=unclassified Rhizobium TaxID=2613769 RepID=UPI0016032C1C|nr:MULTISPECIES: YdcF family protein [unclassified Rhizobium]MBB1249622.1 YdcF family protein [Rhizobium sp. G21]MCV3767401.1 YdcF family protein [Rhizobium sp. TRM95796]